MLPGDNRILGVKLVTTDVLKWSTYLLDYEKKALEDDSGDVTKYEGDRVGIPTRSEVVV